MIHVVFHLQQSSEEYQYHWALVGRAMKVVHDCLLLVSIPGTSIEIMYTMILLLNFKIVFNWY